MLMHRSRPLMSNEARARAVNEQERVSFIRSCIHAQILSIHCNCLSSIDFREAGKFPLICVFFSLFSTPGHSYVGVRFDFLAYCFWINGGWECVNGPRGCANGPKIVDFNNMHLFCGHHSQSLTWRALHCSDVWSRWAFWNPLSGSMQNSNKQMHDKYCYKNKFSNHSDSDQYPLSQWPTFMRWNVQKLPPVSTSLTDFRLRATHFLLFSPTNTHSINTNSRAVIQIPSRGFGSSHYLW